jgi:coenzyme F420-reducing hydrogenase alpha subunit
MSNVIEIKPLTRVEGHGVARIYLDGKRAERVELALTEPPRLFEALLLGKSFEEMPEIICRICSLCSTIHRVTSLLAVENALGVNVSPVTRLYRELIVNGGHIQSHALHLFCLVLPDYFNVASFAELAIQNPDLLKLGLKIKGVGNLIQETIGGRLIHPVNIIPGGMGKRLNRDELMKLQEALEAILPDTVKAYDLFASFDALGPPLPRSSFMAVQGETATPFFGDRLNLSNGRSVSAANYREVLHETVVRHSNAKQSLFEGEETVVGALARLNVGIKLSSRAGQAFFNAREKLIAADIWSNNLAQAAELILAVELSLEIIATLLNFDKGSDKPVTIARQKGSGSAATEAPRGVLIHSYSFDNRGFCTTADIITPTAINQSAMERDLLALAREMEGADDAELKLKLEMLVRAYDPCISCAVHLVRL